MPRQLQKSRPINSIRVHFYSTESRDDVRHSSIRTCKLVFRQFVRSRLHCLWSREDYGCEMTNLRLVQTKEIGWMGDKRKDKLNAHKQSCSVLIWWSKAHNAWVEPHLPLRIAHSTPMCRTSSQMYLPRHLRWWCIRSVDLSTPRDATLHQQEKQINDLLISFGTCMWAKSTSSDLWLGIATAS